MSFKCGIVGLPNVGKSTTFNALTKSRNAEAANFPFCTIEPNIGVVKVPDNRLNNISKIAKSEKTINTLITFVDIAGLVQGASKGEGLGNKFLSHIREVDAIVHLLRCFDSTDIQNVNKKVDPTRDLEIIETELMLADLESLEKRMNKRKNKLEDEDFNGFLFKAYKCLEKGNSIHHLRNEYNEKIISMSNLLSLKPKIIVCNTDENSINGNNYTRDVINKNKNEEILFISAEIEQQINDLEQLDAKDFMNEIGLKETGLDRLIKSSYKSLNLCTYFTAGPQETRAWTVKKNSKAPDAAEVIHTDFKKGFIKAEVISYQDYVRFSGEIGCKENGKLRIEGKDYEIQDGDILHFRFNT